MKERIDEATRTLGAIMVFLVALLIVIWLGNRVIAAASGMWKGFC